ncbi:MAG: CDGSH iron-sulfur domain-containing protein [Planctomycetota bacterium]
MPQPEIPSRRPVVLTLEPGEYLWCTCGRSQTQPFCDGSHASDGAEGAGKADEFTPLKFTIKTKKQFLLCNCKHAVARPFCDGTHNYLA